MCLTGGLYSLLPVIFPITLLFLDAEPDLLIIEKGLFQLALEEFIDAHLRLNYKIREGPFSHLKVCGMQFAPIIVEGSVYRVSTAAAAFGLAIEQMGCAVSFTAIVINFPAGFFILGDALAPANERLQTPDQQKVVDPALRCILCACCTASCPINRANRDYLGPAALLRAFRYIFDSRDSVSAERLAQIDSPDGVWGCKTMWLCTDVCPKGIPVTRCIGQIKRALKKQ